MWFDKISEPKPRRPFRLAVGAFVVLIALFCAGCGGSTGGGSQTAMLRVVNGIWGNPVSVTIEGTAVGEVPYSSCVNEVCTALSGYMSVKSGGLAISVQEQNSTTDILPPQFQKLKLAPNSKNTLVVYADNTTDGTNAALFQDDDVPTANSVKVRVINVSENIPAASAWVVPSGTQPIGSPTINSVSFGSASSYITLSPNSYDIYMPALNCGFDSNCSSITVALPANQNFTIYLLWEGFASRILILSDN
jgi:hypothetical protein